MGGVAVLNPRDIFSTTNNRHKKPLPNRRRRSPPPPRHQSVPSLASVSPLVPKPNQVRILKRGEDIGKNTPDLTVEKPDLKPNRQIGSDPVEISNPIRIPGRKSMPAMFYAGPATSTSPPPSDVPLPAFFAKKIASSPDDATNDLIRILGLELATI